MRPASSEPLPNRAVDMILAACLLARMALARVSDVRSAYDGWLVLLCTCTYALWNSSA